MQSTTILRFTNSQILHSSLLHALKRIFISDIHIIRRPLPNMSTAAVKRKADDSPTDASKKPKSNASITSFFGQPKPVSHNTTTNPKTTDSTTTNLPTGIQGEQAVAGTSVGGAVAAAATNAPATSLPALTKADKFNKEEWIAKLSDEQRELLKLEIETLHESWLPYLADEIKRPEFLALKRFLKKEGNEGKRVFPPLGDVYSWYVLSSASTRETQMTYIAFMCVTIEETLTGCSTGHATRLFPLSAPSFSARILTTVPTKPTAFASPSGPQLQRPHH